MPQTILERTAGESNQLAVAHGLGGDEAILDTEDERAKTARSGPTGMSAFAPLLGDKRTSILPRLTRLGLLGIPVHPASLLRLACATFMILGVVLIRTYLQKMMRP
jgi:hypothetical protein